MFSSASSRNVTKSFAELTNKMTNSIVQESATTASATSGVNIIGGSGSVNITGSTFSSKVKLSKTQIQKAVQKATNRQKLKQVLHQLASATTSGVSFAESSETSNIVKSTLKVSSSISNKIRQACNSNSYSSTTINVIGRDGNINIKGVDLKSLTNSVIKCTQNALQSSKNVQNLQNRMKQVGKAKTKGVSMWAIIVLLVVVGLIILLVMFGPELMEMFAASSAEKQEVQGEENIGQQQLSQHRGTQGVQNSPQQQNQTRESNGRTSNPQPNDSSTDKTHHKSSAGSIIAKIFLAILFCACVGGALYGFMELSSLEDDSIKVFPFINPDELSSKDLIATHNAASMSEAERAAKDDKDCRAFLYLQRENKVKLYRTDVNPSRWRQWKKDGLFNPEPQKQGVFMPDDTSNLLSLFEEAEDLLNKLACINARVAPDLTSKKCLKAISEKGDEYKISKKITNGSFNDKILLRVLQSTQSSISLCEQESSSCNAPTVKPVLYVVDQAKANTNSIPSLWNQQYSKWKTKVQNATLNKNGTPGNMSSIRVIGGLILSRLSATQSKKTEFKIMAWGSVSLGTILILVIIVAMTRHST